MLHIKKLLSIGELEEQFSLLDRYEPEIKIESGTDNSLLLEVYPPNLPEDKERDAAVLKALRESDFEGVENIFEVSKQMQLRPERPIVKIDLNKVEIPDDYIDERMKAFTDKRSRGYLNEVALRAINTEGWYEVVEDYTLPITYNLINRPLPNRSLRPLVGLPTLCELTIPKGFEFDRASIPRIFWVLISKDDLSNLPGLFHDFLYRFGGNVPKRHAIPYTSFEREEADFLFKSLMELTGVKGWRLWAAYQAVKNFSGFAWKGE